MADQVKVRVGSTFQKGGIDAAKSGVRELAGSASESVGKMKQSFTDLAAKVFIVVQAIKKVNETITQFADAYGKQQEVELKLAAAAKNNPYLNGKGVESLKQYAAALQAATTYGDEAIIQQEIWLASLGLTETQIKSLLGAAVNLAATGMYSLESAVLSLSKTYSGVARELGQVIPAIKELTVEELKSGAAIEVVARQYKGLAEAARSSFSGQKTAFQNMVGDVKEQIGSIFAALQAKMYKELTPIFKSIGDWFEKNGPVIYGIFSRLPQIAAIAWRTVLDLARLTFAPENFETIFVQIGTMFIAVMSAAFGVIPVLVEQAGEAIKRSLDKRRKEAASAVASGESLTFGTMGTIGPRDVGSNGVIDTYAPPESKLPSVLGPVFEAFAKAFQESIAALKTGTAVIGDIYGPTLTAALAEIEAAMASAAQEFEDFKAATGGATGAVNDFIYTFKTADPTLRGRQADLPFGEGAAASIPEGAEQAAGLLLDFGASLSTALQSVEAVRLVMDPLGTLLSATAAKLAPFITQILTPVIGALSILGQLLGATLVPGMQFLEQIIGPLGKAFVWLYNNAILPLAQTITFVAVVLIDIVALLANGIIAVINGILIARNWIVGLFGGKPVKLLDYLKLQDPKKAADALQPISESDLTAAGEAAQTTGVYGGNTTVARVPDITLIQYLNGIFIGPDNKEAIGEFCVDSIKEYVSAGGQITFNVAG